MDRVEFEKIVDECLESLPDFFKNNIDNVQISVEDYPNEEQLKKVNVFSKYSLLGLYEGIPLKSRGTSYGMYPVLPDKITLFQKNIEATSKNVETIKHRIREVLMHEIGHYFGMTEDEIRNAGY